MCPNLTDVRIYPTLPYLFYDLGLRQELFLIFELIDYKEKFVFTELVNVVLGSKCLNQCLDFRVFFLILFCTCREMDIDMGS